MPDEPRQPTATRFAFINRLPSWTFLAGLGGYLLLLWLISYTARSLGVRDVIDEYFWTPIVQDEGYNTVNTVFGLMVVLGLVLGWIYRLMAELGEKVDLELTVAVVPYLVWGSLFRVLEDADLFTPFNEAILAAGGAPTDQGASCWPAIQSGFLGNCFGVFLITPIIYVLVTMIAVAIFWIGHKAKHVSERQGAAHGIRFYTLTLVAAFALYVAMWVAQPSFVRFVANPVVALAALFVAWFIVWRDTNKRGTVNPRWVLFAYGVAFLILGLYYVFLWMVNGHPTWGPGQEEVNWWVLAAVIVAPLLLAWSSARKGRALSGNPIGGAPFGRRLGEPGKPATLLIVLLILEGLAVFASILAFHNIEDKLQANTLFDDLTEFALLVFRLALGPVAILIGNMVAWRLARGNFGVHPGLIFFAFPVNLIMIFGQASDGLMTSLGIDVFHYTEKHVLPAFLIDFVDGLGLPSPFGDYPTTLVMVPLKLLIVLGVVWLIDISSRDENLNRQNLVGLVKLAIIMVGLSPGVRDAVRLAMAV